MFGAMFPNGGLSIPDNVVVAFDNIYLAIASSVIGVSKAYNSVSLGAYVTFIDKDDYTTIEVPTVVDAYFKLVSFGGFIWALGRNTHQLYKFAADGSVLWSSSGYFFYDLYSDGISLYAFESVIVRKFNVTGSLLGTASVDLMYGLDSSWTYGTNELIDVNFTSDDDYIYGSLRRRNVAYRISKSTLTTTIRTNETGYGGSIANSTNWLWMASPTGLYRFIKSQFGYPAPTPTFFAVSGTPTVLRYFSTLNAVAVACTGDNKIKFYDADTGAFKYEFSVGTTPSQFSMDSSGNVWVANRSSAFVSLIAANSLL